MESVSSVADRTAKLPILVVDDEPDTCSTMCKLLSALGYQADAVQDGDAALQLVDCRQYGLAILDYEMPTMNGVDLFRRIHQRRPDLAAVFVTGHTTIDVVFPAVEAGVLRIFSKPVDFRQLLPVIEERLKFAGPTPPRG